MPRLRSSRAHATTALGLLLLAVACGAAPSPLPDELLGSWETSQPGYAGRVFEIRKDRILFGTSALRSSAHPLERIERRPDQADQRAYRLHFREHDGELAELELTYHPGPPQPWIRFARRKEIWTPRPSDRERPRTERHSGEKDDV